MKKLVLVTLFIVLLSASAFTHYTAFTHQHKVNNRYEKAKSRYYLRKLFKNDVRKPNFIKKSPSHNRNTIGMTKSANHRYIKNDPIETSIDPELDKLTVSTYIPKKISRRILKVVRLSKRLLGHRKRRFRYSRRSFRADCSGFIMYVFATQKLKLINPAAMSRGGICKVIYKSMKLDGKVHKRKLPKVGDLVFFHNSYDKNRDRKVNDWYSHIGIVEKVSSNGDIQFIHYLNPRKGVTRGRMNLFNPNNRSKNSYLRNRRRYPNPSGQYLTGELFAGFASVN